MRTLLLRLLVTVMGSTFVVSLVHCKHSVMAYSGEEFLSPDCSRELPDDRGRYQSVVRGEEARTLANQPLRIEAEHNGGITLTTWDKPDFSVILCKQVASNSDEKGKKILDTTRLIVNNATVSIKSPHRDGNYNLNTLLLVIAPRSARVSMKTGNGGISVQHFTGTADANSANGGISINQSAGNLTVHSQNGGVFLQDCGGNVTARAENGGLSLILPQQWQGEGLEAHAENGGLVIHIPGNFASSLEITASNYVPISCKGNACDQAQRTWNHGKQMFRLGAGAPQVHVVAVNGGIVIEDREH